MPTHTEERPTITESPGTVSGSPWVVILYNDNYHPIDEVVLQLQKATGCSLERAITVTLTAHTQGRAIAYEGSLDDCERVVVVLREIRLQVETDRAM
ncbi:MAG: ATP-dependent Clp protease adaptor ClpS [Chloroflexi bacterium]|nr:ATP-dependent Clp protease adaptor ClpS [Chloroflexota bacterium]